MVHMQRFSWWAMPMIAATLALGAISKPQAAQAVDCVYRCQSNDIQFLPGQSLQLEVVNHTQGQVNLERILDFEPYLLRPGQVVLLETRVGGGPDLSMVFWDKDYLPIQVMLHRPSSERLQIELLPSGSFTDRAVHVVNDGRVLIY
jgi:hypothetical protein